MLFSKNEIFNLLRKYICDPITHMCHVLLVHIPIETDLAPRNNPVDLSYEIIEI